MEKVPYDSSDLHCDCFIYVNMPFLSDPPLLPHLHVVKLNEPMDTGDDHDVCETPDKLNERSARQDDLEDDPILGVIMGANDNSYLVKGGGKFEVLRNVSEGRLTDHTHVNSALQECDGFSQRAEDSHFQGRIWTKYILFYSPCKIHIHYPHVCT